MGGHTPGKSPIQKCTFFLLFRNRPESATRRMGGHAPGTSPIQKCTFSYYFAIVLNQRSVVWGATRRERRLFKSVHFPIISQSYRISDPSYGGPHAGGVAYSKMYVFLLFRNRPESAIRRMGGHTPGKSPIQKCTFSYYFAIVLNQRSVVWGTTRRESRLFKSVHFPIISQSS